MAFRNEPPITFVKCAFTDPRTGRILHVNYKDMTLTTAKVEREVGASIKVHSKLPRRLDERDKPLLKHTNR